MAKANGVRKTNSPFQTTGKLVAIISPVANRFSTNPAALKIKVLIELRTMANHHFGENSYIFETRDSAVGSNTLEHINILTSLLEM